MSLLKYLSPLTSYFKKDEIVLSCERTAHDIHEHTYPAFKAAADVYDDLSFSAKSTKDFIAIYTKEVGFDRSQNILESIRDRFDMGQKLLQAVADEIKRIYSEHETAGTLTYAKATLMRIIQACDFANFYARRWLNYFYVEEAKANGFEYGDDLVKAEVDYVEDNFAQFCMCMRLMAYDVDTLKKSLREMPDSLITQLSESTLPTTVGLKKLDPVMLNGFTARANPFYLWGMLRAESQARKYKAAQEMKELLTLRLLQLRKQNDKQPDAKLERQINMLQDRVDGINRQLADLEDEYGL